MTEREAAETNAKIHRLMDTIAEQQATIDRLEAELDNVCARLTAAGIHVARAATGELAIDVSRQALLKAVERREIRAFEAIIVAAMRGVDPEKLDKAIEAAEAANCIEVSGFMRREGGNHDEQD